MGFFVNKENTLVDSNKVIHCDKLFSQGMKDNSVIEVLNRHGFNLELQSQESTCYSDSEIEEMYSEVNFEGPSYGGDTCLEYANQLSGNTPSALQYCPEA